MSQLSLSNYFKACDALCIVPKVPKSIKALSAVGEEGFLASELDLRALDINDEDLEAWRIALFTENTV